jgi:hypothetical protein
MNVDTRGDSEGGGGKRLGRDDCGRTKAGREATVRGDSEGVGKRDDCGRTKAGGSGIMAGAKLNVDGALSGTYGMNITSLGLPLLAGRGLRNE